MITPTYPGFEVEVEALRQDPSVIASLTVPATVAHLAGVITELDAPPIIMGHSFGGTLTQLLLDHGCGAVGVAINSTPTEGVRVNPPSQIKSLFPILKNPANRHKAVGFTLDEFATPSPTPSATRTPRRSTTAITSRHPVTGCGPTA